MCGICGFRLEPGYNGSVKRDALERMTETLSRRGPDGSGLFYRTFDAEGKRSGETVGLGHRRLAVIDLVTGDQPIANEDESIRVVANGEIYNFRELRSELEGRGHRFRTKTDVEVIVHLYEEEGAGLASRLNGMFAFAVWDENSGRLVLARDRIGIKPLCYSRLEHGIFFASEAKSLLETGIIQPVLDFAQLDRYLALEYVPSPGSIFKGVNKLPPAHVLVYENDEVKIRRYWSLETLADRGIGNREAAERLRSNLEKAVSKRLVADVPVGIFLSGGIDSSLVAALACRSGGKRIRTFSIGFKDRSFDESRHSRLAAAEIGTDHSERICTPGDMREIVPRLYDILDEPFADASVIPTLLLSEFASANVKVVLGGDGGDELFAGYPTYQAHRLASAAKLMPRVVVERLLPSIVKRLPTSFSNISMDFKAKRFVKGLSLPPVERNVAWLGAFSPVERGELYSDSSIGMLAGLEPFRDLNDLAEECPQDNEIARMMYLDLRTYLVDDILTKVDRASMACGLEVRTPFLDHEFVEFAWSLPLELRLSGLTSKYILKEAARSILPGAIIDRPKKGFGVPIGKWFLGEMRPLLEKYLSPERISEEGIFKPVTVSRLLSDHLARRRDCRKELWTLLSFEMWLEKYRPRIPAISA